MNKIIGIIFVATALMWGHLAFANLSDGLVAHYEFNGNANDATGNSNDGTVNGNVTYQTGITGDGINLEPYSGYVEAGTLLNNLSSVTISGWYLINPEAPTKWHSFFHSQNYCQGGKSFGIMYEKDNKKFRIYDGGSCTGIKDINYSIPNNEWFHFLTTYNGAQISVYINGEHIESTNHTSLLPISNPLMVGANIGSGLPVTYVWDGVIDDFRVYNRALSDIEVRQLYELARPQNIRISHIEDQNVNVPFSITVEKLDDNGNVDTSFNDSVHLSIYGGTVNPTGMTLVNGVLTDNITAYTAGLDVSIYAWDGTTSHGKSNRFNLSGNPGLLGTLTGIITDKAQSPLSGANVYLKSGQSTPLIVTTDASGEYVFSNIPLGIYELWASYNSLAIQGTRSVSITSGANAQTPLEIPTADLVGKYPVILVPGAMGSDTKWRLNYAIPDLPTESPADQNDLKIHDPGEWTVFSTVGGPGWLELRRDLWDAGFVVVECPWDWRYHPGSKEAQNYLLSCINKAKSETGADKVDIVAHSQGGLLTRAYIQNLGYQSTELTAYRNDIDRFVMLGTPNHGSPIAYPMWAGGDPLTADNMAGSKDVDDAFDPSDYFYSHTLDKVYKKSTGENAIVFHPKDSSLGHYEEIALPPAYLVNHKMLRTFIRNNIIATRSLVPENDYVFICNDSTCESRTPLIDFDTKNWWLTDLNNALNNLTDKGVTTKILGSISMPQTIHYSRVLTVSGPAYDGIYEDGMPYAPWDYKNAIGIGDGTVPFSSLTLPGIDSDALFNKGDHAKLPGNFKTEITNFLLSERSITAKSIATLKALATSATTTIPYLSVSLDGQYGLLVTGPDGKKNGVDLDSDTLYEETTGATVYRSGNGISISLPNPPDGTYQFSVTGSLANRVPLTIGFMDVDSQEEFDVGVFFNGTSAIFAYQLSASAGQPLALASSPAAPRYPIKKDNGGLLLLDWEHPGDITPASYKIYTRIDTEPFYTLLATIPATETTYQTSHLIEEPKRFYVVSTLDSKGTEGILTPVINNHIPSQYHLSILAQGTGKGTVTSSTDGINCGDDCREFYNVGETITLTATPADEASFIGWVGNGCSGSEESCTVIMDQARGISAVFATNPTFPWTMFLPAITTPH